MSLSNFLKKIRKKKEGPSGTSWKDILNEIYTFAPHIHGESSKMSFSDDEHDLARKLKITGHELMLGISFLEANGLVKRNVETTPSYSARLHLTEKGFDVAIKNESFKVNKRLQEIVAISISLTALIAGTSFFLNKLISSLSSFKGWLIIIFIINLIFILVIVFVIGFLLVQLIVALWSMLFKNKK